MTQKVDDQSNPSVASATSAELDFLRCENLFLIVGEEYKCENKAKFVFDKGEISEMNVCEKCAKNIHVSRLTGIQEKEDE